MPSNMVEINGSAGWIIPDSKMDELIGKLNEWGDKEHPEDSLRTNDRRASSHKDR